LPDLRHRRAGRLGASATTAGEIVSSDTGSREVDPRLAAFGANEWLVDEIYEQYLKDKSSVAEAWHEFFADYVPGERTEVKLKTDGVAIPAPVVTSISDQVAQQAPAVAAPTPPPAAPAAVEVEPEILRGPAGRVVANMEESLEVPTATSVRTVPATLLIENRTFINEHLNRTRGGKVSFTHLIAWAVVKAMAKMPSMNASYVEHEGKPAIIKHPNVNIGLAIDLAKPDGSRQLLVPNVKAADTMEFATFWATYDDLVRRARDNKLAVTDFAGTTITLTNPGTIGTVHSVPRLMKGQGAIIGVGALDFPAEWQGAAVEVLARNGIGKILTLTSTYDHRIIQGAASGEFLKIVGEMLLGKHDFYEEVFQSLRITFKPYLWVSDVDADHEDAINKVARVQALIHAYRTRGHLIADTNPLEYKQRTHPDLRMSSHGLSVWDLERSFPTGGFGNKPFMKLRDILLTLREAYCRSIAVEYMHIADPAQRQWMQDRVERSDVKPPREEQLRILRKLNAAEAFENFLQTKYVGQKRFSLEGGESTIAALDAILSEAANSPVQEVTIAMPHRGRLNVLANIAGKSYGQIFREFEDAPKNKLSVQGSGDVKYHLGTEGEYEAPNGEKVKVYLAANPSHLEAVNPVLEGIARAKTDQLDREQGFPVLPILLHGDAAFAGQGVVAETLHMSQLRGYRVGGTIHVVVNNQVGFTTSPTESRSSTYATSVARMVQAPIFHVNGDDPEAVVRISRLAFEYRQEFNKDVVIDLICYRRRGHNEADDPSLTQPLMYDIIDNKRSVRKLYTEALIGRGDITVDEAESALKDYQDQLERVFTETREELSAGPVETAAVESLFFPQPVATAVPLETLEKIAKTQIELPADVTPHPRLWPQLQKRAAMLSEDSVDWGTGEMFAIGSLLLENRLVRISGQDSRRGTFGQRHAVIVDKETGNSYFPLKEMSKRENAGRLYIYDSLLSEYAVMGFEYGYSVANKDALVIWEAQFGDFANGAQTIIDEFISSGEQKWGQTSRVVLLLPHGYEGQGPDHSSGRIERFLSLCAQDNMTVAYPSTPASYFHLLRWQALQPHVKPMVVFTPKSLLRSKLAASAAADFTTGEFKPVIDDASVDKSKVKRVVLCTGKVYYNLLTERETRNITDIALVRVERLYPLPAPELAALLSHYPDDVELVWAQEEPANQGAWPFMGLEFPTQLQRSIRLVSRPAASSPAVGSHKLHDEEQANLVSQALS
jgi:multifunctional 2-oxoglutarate metabolism enzyme